MPPTNARSVVQPKAGTASRRRSCRRRPGWPRTGPGACPHRRGRSSPSAVTISAASSESMVRPSLADEVSDAATERDAAEPDRAGVAEAGGQAMRGRRPRCTRPPSDPARPRPCGAWTSISIACMSRRSMHDAALGSRCGRRRCGRRCARRAACRSVARQRDHVRRLRHVRDPDDDRRPSIDATGHDGARCVIVGIVGRDDPTAKVGSELGDRELIGHRQIVASPGQARESLGARSVDQASGS